MKRILLAACIFGLGILVAATSEESFGNETVNYSYDARGRLTNVSRSGTVNDGLQSNYTYDKADNRVVVNVTGSPN